MLPAVSYKESYPLMIFVAEQQDPFLPKYGLENAVAEFYYSTPILKIPIESGTAMFSTEYLIRAYNSKIKSEQIAKFGNTKMVENFIRGRNFDVIEFYEWVGVSDELHSKPSAIIYKSNNLIQVRFDLEGQNELADGNFDFIYSPNKLDMKLIVDTCHKIFYKRAFDRLKRDGLLSMPH